MQDANALADLWHVEAPRGQGAGGADAARRAARAGRAGLVARPDGSRHHRGGCEAEAYWDAGYTGDDGTALAALWHVDVYEAKATAGQMLRAGEPLPIRPSGTPAS